MIEKFRDKKFSPERLRLLEKAIAVFEDYSAQDIKLTLRQLYYQLVASDIIPNRQQEYKRLSETLTDARYCGLVDWEAIEDRIRIPTRHAQFEDIPDLVEAAISSYRLDRWKGQEYYVELFTEKDALSSVLEPITDKYHVTLNVNRGYGSATAIYDTSKRFLRAKADKKKCILLYLGDHDPSGLDMVRDIRRRLAEFCGDMSAMLTGKMFGVDLGEMGEMWRDFGENMPDEKMLEKLEVDAEKTKGKDISEDVKKIVRDIDGNKLAEEMFGDNKKSTKDSGFGGLAKGFPVDKLNDTVKVIPIALTMEQIRQYNPPPNPAKITDPRAKWYISKYGDKSWEVDALKPDVTQKLVTDAVEQYLDWDKYQRVIEREEQDKSELRKLSNDIRKSQ